MSQQAKGNVENIYCFIDLLIHNCNCIFKGHNSFTINIHSIIMFSKITSQMSNLVQKFMHARTVYLIKFK